MRRVWGRRGLAVALTALGLVGGCTGDPRDQNAVVGPPTAVGSTAEAPSDPAPPTQPATVSEIWRTPLPLVGEAVGAGDVAVAYVTTDAALALVGLDAATGEQLWSQPAGPAYVVPGIAVTPEVVEDEDGTEYPAYFRPALATSLNASLVVADPRTGEDDANAGRAVYSSPPRRCDDGIDVCFESGSALQGEVTRRLPLSRGIVVEEPQAPGYVRGVGPLGLSDVRE